HLLLFFAHRSAPPQTSPLSLHDALPICQAGAAGRRGTGETPHHAILLANGARPRRPRAAGGPRPRLPPGGPGRTTRRRARPAPRSEEHTSELQSLTNLVCRLLLEKTKHT